MQPFETQAVAYLKGELSEKEKKAFEESLAQSADLRTELERSRELLDLLEAASEEANVRRNHAIIQEAIQRGASDIHIVPQCRAVIVDFRLDGRLHEYATFPIESHQPMIDHFKKMAECHLKERQVPQDGRISIQYEGKEYDLRVTFLPTLYGERMTARILSKQNVLLGLENLGMSVEQQEAVHRMTERSFGLIIAAGAVNCGKTTLLYSMLRHIQAREEASKQRRSLFTLEDPVEYAFPGMSQTNVKRVAGLTFAAGLRTILRSDANVVMIGELRDLENAELATEMVITGRLVLTVLHVGSAVCVSQRLREMGVVPHLTAQGLAGAVGQRLVRKVCPDCATEYEPSPEELHKAGLTKQEGPFRRGAGCPACFQTGYKGRIGLFEVLEVSDRLRHLIAEDAPLEALWTESFGRTGGSLWDDAHSKVRQGLTTVEEVTWALGDYPRLDAKPAAGA